MTIAHDELTILAKIERIVELTTFLRDNPGCRFQTLIDICGVDFPEREQRFEVVYHFLSMHQNIRVRVKLAVREDEIVPSITDVHPSADWFEP